MVRFICILFLNLLVCLAWAQRIIVNEGNPLTNKKKITIQIYGSDITYVIISSDPISGKNMSWKTFIPNNSWKLDEKEGAQYIHFKFKFENGKISKEYIKKIYVDFTPPIITRLNINKGASYTTKRKVKLELLARQANDMLISESKNFLNTHFISYSQTKDWELSQGDGLKNIYMLFRDKAHNLTDTLVRSIILDTQAPNSVGILINNGKTSTLIPDIELEAKAEGAMFMQISEKKSFENIPWRIYHSTPFSFKLSGDYGIKNIYIRCKDEAGNISDTGKGTINFIIKPVRASISINNGAEFCSSADKKVILNLFAVYANEMIVSHFQDFRDAKWETFKKTKNWTLEQGDGIKIVYTKYRSKTNTESVVCFDKILLDTKPPVKCNFSISSPSNQLNPYTVSIEPFAEGASYMQISQFSNFLNTHWLPYSSLPFSYVLTLGEGKKKLYMRFKDEYGNMSKSVSQTTQVILPSLNGCRVWIDKQKHFTNRYKEKLRLYAPSASELRISNLRTMLKTASWQNYDTVKYWRLDEGQGFKKIFVQFRDKYKNVSKIVETKIELDTEEPKNISFSILEGKYCNNEDRSVNLSLHALGASRMMISNDNSFKEAVWIKYVDKYKNWKLTESDGLKNVYVKFADQSGNETKFIEEKITLDRKIVFENTMIINQDKRFTNKPAVKLTFDCAEEISEMMISTKANFPFPAHWEKFSKEKKWYFSLPDGKKVVYAKFKDEAGNETTTIQDSIILDTEPPVPYYIQINRGATAVDGTTVTLYTKVKDVKKMKIGNHPFIKNTEWINYFSKKEWILSSTGLQKIYVIFQDSAGNISKVFQDEITVY